LDNVIFPRHGEISTFDRRFHGAVDTFEFFLDGEFGEEDNEVDGVIEFAESVNVVWVAFKDEMRE